MLCGAVLLGLCSCGVKSAQEPGAAAPVDTEFVSDDGTIRVRLHGSDADDIPAAMPVLRARPQVITLGMRGGWPRACSAMRSFSSSPRN